jgi:hypothetical protein
MATVRTLVHIAIAMAIGMSPLWLPVLGFDVASYFPRGRLGNPETNAFKFTAFLCLFYMMGVTLWSRRDR